MSARLLLVWATISAACWALMHGVAGLLAPDVPTPDLATRVWSGAAWIYLLLFAAPLAVSRLGAVSLGTAAALGVLALAATAAVTIHAEATEPPRCHDGHCPDPGSPEEAAARRARVDSAPLPAAIAFTIVTGLGLGSLGATQALGRRLPGA